MTNEHELVDEVPVEFETPIISSKVRVVIKKPWFSKGMFRVGRLGFEAEKPSSELERVKRILDDCIQFKKADAGVEADQNSLPEEEEDNWDGSVEQATDYHGEDGYKPEEKQCESASAG